MNRIEALKHFYQSELLPHLTDIDSKRKWVLARLGATIIGGVGLTSYMAYFIYSSAEDKLIMLMFIPLFTLLILAFYLLFETVVKGTSYYRNYKRDVIYKLIKFIHPELRYDKHRFVSQKDYFRAGFFPPVPVDYDGEDHVSGIIEGTKIEFCELEVKHRRASDRKATGKAYQFRGILFAAETADPFPADVIIEPKGMELPAGHMLLPISNEQFNEVLQARLPKPEYAEMAMDMMNDDFVKKVVRFNSLIKNEVHISLIYNKIYLGVIHHEDLFEPALTSSVVDFSAIQRHYEDLYYPISLIEYIMLHKDFEVLEERTTPSNVTEVTA